MVGDCLFSSEAKSREELCEVCVLRDKVPMMSNSLIEVSEGE